MAGGVELPAPDEEGEAGTEQQGAASGKAPAACEQAQGEGGHRLRETDAPQDQIPAAVVHQGDPAGIPGAEGLRGNGETQVGRRPHQRGLVRDMRPRYVERRDSLLVDQDLEVDGHARRRRREVGELARTVPAVVDVEEQGAGGVRRDADAERVRHAARPHVARPGATRGRGPRARLGPLSISAAPAANARPTAPGLGGEVEEPRDGRSPL